MKRIGQTQQGRLNRRRVDIQPKGVACGRVGRAECGAAVLEMAVVLPVALLVFTALLQFGVYINNSLELENATSLAGQYLAVNRGTTAVADPCNLTVSAFESVAPQLVPTSNLNFSFVFTTSGGSSVTYTNRTTCTAGASYIAQGATAQITVTYPCNLALFGVNLSPGCNIAGQVTEVIQ